MMVKMEIQLINKVNIWIILLNLKMRVVKNLKQPLRQEKEKIEGRSISMRTSK